MASIERRLYSLERKLVRERAQLAIRDFVEAVMLRWEDFAASDQDAFFLVHDLGAQPDWPAHPASRRRLPQQVPRRGQAPRPTPRRHPPRPLDHHPQPQLEMTPNSRRV